MFVLTGREETDYTRTKGMKQPFVDFCRHSPILFEKVLTISNLGKIKML